MSQGICPSCGAEAKLTAEQNEANCTYCGSVFARQEAESEYNGMTGSNLGKLMMLAEAAHESDNYEAAIKYCTQANEEDPTFGGAWLKKGQLQVDAGSEVKDRNAIGSWKCAIKFAKNRDAMARRVALAVNSIVTESYVYYQKRIREHVEESSKCNWHGDGDGCSDRLKIWLHTDFIYYLEFALECDPNSRIIADTGNNICDEYQNAIEAIASYPCYDDKSFTFVNVGLKHKATFQEALFRIDPSLREAAEAAKAAKAAAAQEAAKSQSKKGCFVATACYGNYDHPAVLELRQFRDKRLESHKLGRTIIGWYYSWSPSVAALIRRSEALKGFVRLVIIQPAVFISRMVSAKEK